MTILNMKHKWQCPSTMTAQSVGRIVLAEYKCVDRAGHEGFHRSKEGVVWDNTGKLLENLEKSGDKPNRPLIFLGNG
jgi:hypothetical protein